jgi:hypothetical protein
MALYQFSIQDDFPDQTISAKCLDGEINASSITANLVGIVIIDDDVNIEFDSPLTSGEENTLEFIVGNHDYNCPAQQQQDEQDQAAKEPIAVQKDDISINSAVNIINFEGDVNVIDEGDNKVTVNVESGNSVYGTEFHEVESDSESSTTSSSWREKLELEVNNLPAGKYKIEWYFEHNGTSDAGGDDDDD